MTYGQFKRQCVICLRIKCCQFSPSRWVCRSCTTSGFDIIDPKYGRGGF